MQHPARPETHSASPRAVASCCSSSELSCSHCPLPRTFGLERGALRARARSRASLAPTLPARVPALPAPRWSTRARARFRRRRAPLRARGAGSRRADCCCSSVSRMRRQLAVRGRRLSIGRFSGAAFLFQRRLCLLQRRLCLFDDLAQRRRLHLLGFEFLHRLGSSHRAALCAAVWASSTACRAVASASSVAMRARSRMRASSDPCCFGSARAFSRAVSRESSEIRSASTSLGIAGLRCGTLHAVILYEISSPSVSWP